MIKNRFKEILDSRGIKQKFIYDKIGAAPSTISAIYKGFTPSLETALKIAKVLDMKVEDIWSVEEDNHGE